MPDWSIVGGGVHGTAIGPVAQHHRRSVTPGRVESRSRNL